MAADYPDIDIAPLIDHTLLTPTATPEQVEQWCNDADTSLQLFAYILHTCGKQLNSWGKNPKVCTVIGFPTGATTSAVKLYEAQDAVEKWSDGTRCRH